ENYYSYIDDEIAINIVYYRLKVVDKDNSFKYSRVVSVKFGERSNLFIYPNPASDKIFIETDKEIERIILQDLKGNRLPIDVEGENQRKIVDVSKLPRGLYVLHVQTIENTWVEKIVIQR
ncbi:MAG: T9SS type A sorting domain-containing protein, partial [Raineya sp.]|nr:T9SS type A sorting domain-containing protein [Raineya sp.]